MIIVLKRIFAAAMVICIVSRPCINVMAEEEQNIIAMDEVLNTEGEALTDEKISPGEAALRALGDPGMYGSCGDSLSYSLESNGDYSYKLTITGNGDMYGYSPTDSPWYSKSSQITEIEIGAGATSIGNHAFNGCSGLTSINIPVNIASIGHQAFFGCGFSSIFIPKNVKYIGANPFSKCEKLSSIVVDKENTVYNSRNSCNAIVSSGGVLETGCNNTVIPNNVKRILRYAFLGSNTLNDITIPVSVTLIDDYAFYSCENLKNVYYAGSETDWNRMQIGSHSFPENVTVHYNHSNPGDNPDNDNGESNRNNIPENTVEANPNLTTKTINSNGYTATLSMNNVIPWATTKSAVISAIELKYEYKDPEGNPTGITVKSTKSTKPSKKKGTAKVTVKLKGSNNPEKKAVKQMNKQLKKIVVRMEAASTEERS